MILISGSQGFIGSHTVEFFLERGHEVVGIDNQRSGFLDEAEKSGKFHSVIGELNEDNLRAIGKVDSIVHLAAFNSIPKSIINPDQYIRNNTLTMQSILEYAKDFGIKRVVYASSSSVTNKIPSPYSISKRMNELQAQTYSAHYGLECIGLRFFNVFGPRQKYKELNAPVIPKWIYQMMKGEDIIIRDGDQVSRDFTYVYNVCSAIYKSIMKENLSSEVFKVGCGDSITLNELAEYLFDSVPSKVYPPSKIIREGLRLGEKSYSKADINNTARALGYCPLVGWREGVQRTIDWIARETQMSIV